MRMIEMRAAAQRCLCLVFLSGVAFAAGGEIVYDNSDAYEGTFFPTLVEYGDEVRLVGSARTVVDFRFEYFGEFTATGQETARVRFYANDGAGQPGFQAPGTQLYDSGSFPIYPGFNTKVLAGISVTVPADFTWTVQFGGLQNVYNNRAGLTLYNPPIAGASFDDYWQNTPDTSTPPAYTWALWNFGKDYVANYSAKITAIPDPGITVVSQTRLTNGLEVLQLAGPAGRDYVLQLSTNLADWVSVSTNTLSTSTTTLLDDHGFALAQVFYRGLLLPETDIRLSAAHMLTNGRLEFQYTGPMGRHLTVYASTNLTDWLPIATRTFVGEPVAFTDSQATNFTGRFYHGELAPEPPAVVGTGSFRTDGPFQFPLSGRPGHDFEVRVSSDLVTWTTLGTNTFTFTSGYFNFVDFGATNYPDRFYWIIPLP